MSIRIEQRQAWDDTFFQDWARLHARIYQNVSRVLPETTADLAKLLKDPKTFPDDRWVALSLYKNDQLSARALVAVSRQRPEIAKVGFIETEEDPLSFRYLWDEVERVAREFGAKKIKGPINLHFFASYRWKLWGKARPFYGEPQQPGYYLEFFQAVGMQQIKSWDTFRIRFFRSKRQYGEIRKSKKPDKRLHIRGIDMKRFDEEMALIHRLFHETFKDMPEFEALPLETFITLYSGFRYIISPTFAFIIEHEGKPIAFCVNFMDPQHVLVSYEKLKTWMPQKLLEIWTFIRIKMNFKRLLIMYVGRLPAPDGREYQGIQSLVAKKMTVPVALSIPDLYICYTAEDSPALKSYKEDQKELLSQYALFAKSLE